MPSFARLLTECSGVSRRKKWHSAHPAGGPSRVRRCLRSSFSSWGNPAEASAPFPAVMWVGGVRTPGFAWRARALSWAVSGWETVLGPALRSGTMLFPVHYGSVVAHDRNGFSGRMRENRWMNRRRNRTQGRFGDMEQDGMAVLFRELTTAGVKRPTSLVPHVPLLKDQCLGRSEHLAGPCPRGGQGILTDSPLRSKWVSGGS